MNIRLLSRLLGILSVLIGGFMVFSLPWSMPGLGHRSGPWEASGFERDGFQALVSSIIVCLAVGGLLFWLGRSASGKLYRKEAMAVVGLSWVLATVLGALPFYMSGTGRGPAVKISSRELRPLIANGTWQWISTWHQGPALDDDEYAVLAAIAGSSANSRGLPADQLVGTSQIDDAEEVFARLKRDPAWEDVLLLPGEGSAPSDRASNYRIRWVHMTVCDALFESQSGFSTTGASVISDLEDPDEVPLCILFWRSSTHFLGGLGIIVLFVVLLGQGSAGKTLMRTEVPGPSAEGPAARMQHSAWAFAAIYVALNAMLTLILVIQGMSLFDALCHAFGTMATGGFSTWNTSLGHFNSPAIQYTVIVFMILAGTNFTLLYWLVLRQPGRLLADVEWRTYMILIGVVTLVILAAAIPRGDEGFFSSLEFRFRTSLFQVVSVMTTTGYATSNFDSWSHIGRLVLLMLMFVGGCAGSTGGGLKVIRHVLMARILWIGVEKVFHPRVVRPLRLGGTTETSEQELKYNVLVYLAVIVALFVFGWLVVVAVEPDWTWGNNSSNKLIDSASAVAATLNNIGPGLGIVGPVRNYSEFSGVTKMLFVWLMMLGRLEIWPIIVLFAPRFWKDQ